MAAGKVEAGTAVWGSGGQTAAAGDEASTGGQAAVPESGGQVAVGDEEPADGQAAADGSPSEEAPAGGQEE
ncbi:hypothetical protein ACFTT0_16310 [Streptomyces bauhiniae]|uniref:hypothetical protein n=1 Tax=Streptomyces bauhiniae TaxID=2340725 RepID=UPI003630D483